MQLLSQTDGETRQVRNWYGFNWHTLIIAEALYASPDPGLFIRSFCAGLTDPNPLVQRGFLELLLKNVPLSLPILQE
jgi:hypothetical protein